MMRELVLVFIGGGLGSVARFSLAKWINSLHAQNFPFGTLVVNIIACFILGFVIGLADNRQLISPASRLFWTVGFCGGFSTFSTFSNETLLMVQGGLTLPLVAYIFLSLILCVGATFAGIYAGEHSFS